MNSSNVDIGHFSKHLFWDTDRASLSVVENRSYIIKQVLEYGFDNDWKFLREIYSLDEIKNAVMRMRELDKKALSFIACLTHTDIRDFQCYSTIQLNQAPWIY